MELTTGSASMTRPICRQSKCNLAWGLVPRDPREAYRFAKRITRERQRLAHRGSQDSGVGIDEIKRRTAKRLWKLPAWLGGQINVYELISCYSGTDPSRGGSLLPSPGGGEF
jgi:hypothetical protein